MQNIIIDKQPNIDTSELGKMKFIYNALQSGWKIQKKRESYIFTRKHEGKKEVFVDTYIKQFIEDNI